MTAKKKPKPKDFTKKPTWKCQLAAIRKERGLSLQGMADLLELSRIGYYQIECGGDPMLSTAVRIEAKLGMTRDQIWLSKKKV